MLKIPGMGAHERAAGKEEQGRVGSNFIRREDLYVELARPVRVMSLPVRHPPKGNDLPPREFLGANVRALYAVKNSSHLNLFRLH